jgi:hypothetical protein
MNRKLLDGREVEESKENVDIIIRTKCPKKWRITDMETGQIYEGTGDNDLYKQWKLIGRLKVKGVKRELNKKLRNGNWTTKEIIEAMDKIK